MKFQRETATHEADLPHKFQLQETAMLAKLCAICDMTARDPRHLAWERQDLNDREQAHVALQRETGT